MIQRYTTTTDGRMVQYVTTDPDVAQDMVAMETTMFHGLTDYDLPAGTIRATSAAAARAIAVDLNRGRLPRD